MSDDGGISIGELSRQVRDVLIRFNTLATRLEDNFVSKEFLSLKIENLASTIIGLDQQIKKLEQNSIEKGEYDTLASRVSALEDDKKWLIRLVVGFIILGILGAFIAFSPGGVK